MIPRFVIHLLSGGLDSVVLLYDLLKQGCRVHALLFEYGQRHQVELDYAKSHCRETNTPFTIICLPTLQGSALTDSGEGFVVPFRNPIMLAMAVNLAVAQKADSVTIACNADDAEMFPDCRWAAMDALNHAIRISRLNVEICAPYVNKTKREIVAIGRTLGLDFTDTWSCYRGGNEPCGKCPACIKRTEALAA